jgi:hypothetical protein
VRLVTRDDDFRHFARVGGLLLAVCTTATLACKTPVMNECPGTRSRAHRVAARDKWGAEAGEGADFRFTTREVT